MLSLNLPLNSQKTKRCALFFLRLCEERSDEAISQRDSVAQLRPSDLLLTRDTQASKACETQATEGEFRYNFRTKNKL